MKRIIICAFLLFSIACFAVNKVDYTPQKSLLEISRESEIPVKKWIQYLELPQNTNAETTLSQLKLSQKKLDKAFDLYLENEKTFYAGVVVVGMLIVFTSLIITGMLISQLEHFSKKKSKKKTVKTSVGKVTGPAEHISSSAIVAAITAVYLHEIEVEEQNKLLLTWKRAPLSVWKTAKLMPNNAVLRNIKR